MDGTSFRLTEQELVTLRRDDLIDFGRAVLGRLGAGDAAPTVAESLAEADLRGLHSHGVRRLAWYAEHVDRGLIDPVARPRVLPDGPRAAVRVDGQDAFGQLTARAGVDALREVAPGTGVAVAVLRRCQHVGRLGEYVESLAAAGLVGIAFANADACVAPWGGRERMLGTNPTAWAVPTAPGTAPLVVDFATSATAEGRLAVARAAGERVPEGLLVDAEGEDSTDPEDFYAGGALLSAGAHKGYGLAVAFDLVAGLLSGTGSASSPDFHPGFGTVLAAIDVSAYVDPDRFVDDVEAFRSRVRAAAPRPGTDAVLVPGDPEWRAREAALRDGVRLDPAVRADLDRLAERLDVDPLPHPDPEEES